MIGALMDIMTLSFCMQLLYKHWNIKTHSLKSDLADKYDIFYFIEISVPQYLKLWLISLVK